MQPTTLASGPEVSDSSIFTSSSCATQTMVPADSKRKHEMQLQVPDTGTPSMELLLNLYTALNSLSAWAHLASKIAFMQESRAQVIQKAALLLAAHCRYMLSDKPSPTFNQCAKQHEESHPTSSGCKRTDSHRSTMDHYEVEGTTSQNLEHRPNGSLRRSTTGTCSMLSGRTEPDYLCSNTQKVLTVCAAQNVSDERASMTNKLSFAEFLDGCNPLCAAAAPSHAHSGILTDVRKRVKRVTAHMDLTASHHTSAANAEMESDCASAQVICLR